MTTSTDYSDDQGSSSTSSQIELTEFEAGLRRVLAYLCERRYRRRIVFAIAFIVLYFAIETLFSTLFLLLVTLADAVGWFDFYDIFSSLTTINFVLSGIRLVPPIGIALLIFMRLSKIYRTR